MAKSTRTAQHLDASVTPAATTVVKVTAYRAPSSDWERANVAAGWHVTLNTPGGPVDGMVRSVGQDNRTLTVETATGTLTVSKPDVMVVLVRPVTEWEAGMVAKVAQNAKLVAFYQPPQYDVLSVCHVIREHWFRLSGGAKTGRVLKAMESQASGQTLATGTAGKAVPSALAGLAAPAPTAALPSPSDVS